MKIGIMGCGGTGKTLTGFNVANYLDIEFLASREITNEILKRDGYEYNIQVEKFLAQQQRQKDILEKLQNRESLHSSFVTDRTLVDIAAYALVELHNSDPKYLKSILTMCEEHAKEYTHLFVCPWAGIDLRRNNLARTLNPYYQLLIQETQIGLLIDWGIDFYMLRGTNAEKRLEEIKEVL